MTEIWGVSISHQTILKIMELAAQVAEDLNKELDLSDEKVALFDEIFQKQNPLLVFASPNSAVVNVQASQDRSGDSWKEFLKSLKKRHGSLALVFPDTPGKTSHVATAL